MKLIVFGLLLTNILFIVDPFTQLTVLEGGWKMETANGTIYETWNKPANTSMEGWSYKVNGTDTTMKESIILQKGDSSVNYIVTTDEQNNRESVSFKLVSARNKIFTFENKQHHFPKRIIYTVITNDSVAARIEGDLDGSNKSFDFKYSRIK